MASSGGSFKIPEYTPGDAKAWIDKQGSTVMTLSDVLLIAFGLIGLVVFILGIAQYMRERRESALGGGGGSSQFGLWMMVAGGILGAIDIIMLLLVGIVKPPGA